MSKPAPLPALAMFAVAAACAACNASEPRPTASTWTPRAHAFLCQASARPNLYARPESIGEIRMTEPGDRSISSGAFRFRVLYSNDGYESPTLITYVYSTATGKLIEEALFQLDRQKDPVNQFMGGHGFTGLHYVYAPDSAAELQYICSHG